MKQILVKPIDKSAAEILIGKLMFKSDSDSLSAFNNMSITKFFRKLRDSRAKQKTF